MTKKQQRLDSWFIEQRTYSLATVYLTRRDDLLITEARPEDGVDLNVTIKTKRRSVQRKLGVLLRGVQWNLPADQANELLKPSMEALSARAFPYLVCLLL